MAFTHRGAIELHSSLRGSQPPPPRGHAAAALVRWFCWAVVIARKTNKCRCLAGKLRGSPVLGRRLGREGPLRSELPSRVLQGFIEQRSVCDGGGGLHQHAQESVSQDKQRSVLTVGDREQLVCSLFLVCSIGRATRHHGSNSFACITHLVLFDCISVSTF